jgi:hypothetical protein
MRVAATVIGCLVVALSWAGCSSTDNQPKASAGKDGGSHDDGGRDPNLNCVKPGTSSNEKGVGGYCETNADCPSVAGGFILCSGSFATTPLYSWFCTTLCNVDADCGTGAFCGHSDLGNGCVPNACGAQPDGGSEGSTEGGDAAGDAASDHAVEAAPEASPDVAGEAAPDAPAESATDAAPDGGADAAPDIASPDASSADASDASSD